MKKLLKKATVSAITAAIFGSIIPMKTHAEDFTKPTSQSTFSDLNTEASIPAPAINQFKQKTLEANQKEVEAPPVILDDISSRFWHWMD